jgi:tetratricopeptide (TPR) repeat protein
MQARPGKQIRRKDPPLRRPADASRLHRVLDLQSTAGNQAVVHLLQRQAVDAPAAPEVLVTTDRKTLRFGSTGGDVSYLQSRLNGAIEVTTHLAVDGEFGSKTHKAVRQFQQAHAPLKVDGVVGPLTWAEVEKIPGVPTGENAELAGKIFNRGAEEYDKGRYAHAYDFFTRAGELHPRPGIVFSRAQALRNLGGRREEAIALYEQYLGMEGGTRKADAAAHLAELRGPAKTGDETTDTAAGKALFEKGAVHYDARRYGHAYDEFTKAWNVLPRPGILFSRAQSLRSLGGRREEAIALYEEYLGMEGGTRKADAAMFLAELRGPAKTGDETTDTAAGKALFEKGAAHYDARRYGHAYDEFTKAWNVLPRPGILFSRAQSLRNLGGRREEAIALYEEYLGMEGGTRKADARLWINELRQSGGAP